MSYAFLLEYCMRCNWKKCISPYKCECINKANYLRKRRILLESQDVDRLYYRCTFCASTHSIHKKDVPLFTCTNNSNLDWYKCCKRLDTNCILKKICNQCIVPTVIVTLYNTSMVNKYLAMTMATLLLTEELLIFPYLVCVK